MYFENDFGTYKCCQSIKSMKSNRAAADATRTTQQKEDLTLTTAHSEAALSPVHVRIPHMPPLLLPETVSRASTSEGTIAVVMISANTSGQLTSITMPDDCSDGGYFP